MLDRLAEHLAKLLQGSGIIMTAAGIVDIIIERDGDNIRKYPAVYQGNDSLRFITSYDFHTGLAFFTNGRSTISQLESKRACADLLSERARPELILISIRPHVASIPEMKDNLKKILSLRNNRDIREQTGLNSIVGGPISFNTDPETALNDVFEGIDIPRRHDLMFMRVELDYTMTYYTNCIEIKCP